MNPDLVRALNDLRDATRADDHIAIGQSAQRVAALWDIQSAHRPSLEGADL